MPKTKKNQSEETMQTSEPDLDRRELLESSDREFKINTITI